MITPERFASPNRSVAQRVPFCAVAAAAMQQLDAVLAHWLPNGNRQGQEYVALNPVRSDARPGSFKVNLATGAWSGNPPMI